MPGRNYNYAMASGTGSHITKEYKKLIAMHAATNFKLRQALKYHLYHGDNLLPNALA